MESLHLVNLPDRISGLRDLSCNLWWSWQHEARGLFKTLDRALWKSTGHNPIKVLNTIPYSRLVACSEDDEYLKKYDAVMELYEKNRSNTGTWFQKTYPDRSDSTIAYFSLEFAIHNSLPLYAGGLGVLAGDYCKEASDLGIPLVGVGFMYPQGYFHQQISRDGWQTEIYDNLEFDNVAVSRVLDIDGKKLLVQVPLDSTSINVACWLLKVGRVNLYLLDTNLLENPMIFRELSAKLYGGDRETRLLQEIVIGIGGVKLLRALGISPRAWHANEGHCTFMMIERLVELVEKGMEFEKAVSLVSANTVFTTHTPLQAGNDTFSMELIEKYFHKYWERLGIGKKEFMQLGTYEADKLSFNMTVLGMKLAEYRNGVSKLHGLVCRKMWNPIWPELSEEEVPITSITNGIHIPTWISPQFTALCEANLGKDWLHRQDDPSMWEGIKDASDELMWAMHQWRKMKLITSILKRARQRWAKDRVAPEIPLATGALLDMDVLTIGFCRRFTGYKRATLILKDIQRLKKLIGLPVKPLQIIFAGKAHPSDEIGKMMIQQIFNIAKDPEFGGRIAFIEDYDMHMAHDLVSGVDLWLNTPKTLMEASGTSGQKASVNGVMNFSILDGWWYEGFNGSNGWAVNEYGDSNNTLLSEDETAKRLYEILEERIIPLYYERDLNGVPHGWIRMMKETIRTNSAFFNTTRMAKEYTQRFYMNAIHAEDSN